MSFIFQRFFRRPAAKEASPRASALILVRKKAVLILAWKEAESRLQETGKAGRSAQFSGQEHLHDI
jgi:hypothetical protein